jgi:hypothetical protein
MVKIGQVKRTFDTTPIDRLKWAENAHEWIIIGQRRECLTTDQEEKEDLEDLS